MLIKVLLFLTVNLLLLSPSAKGQEEQLLIRICAESPCERGTPSGYVNQSGDTIIPIAHYFYCFTDTIRHIGFVVDTTGTYKAINQLGEYLFDVKAYEMGPDRLSDGLFRIVINGKIGYANAKGEIIIPPQFSCTSPFENGRARVTYSCTLVPDGEHTVMQSDTWFYIDKKGMRIEEK